MAKDDKHAHTAKCYTVQRTCGQFEHKHAGNACYKQDGTLKCSTSEHTHSKSCDGAVGPICGYP